MPRGAGGARLWGKNVKGNGKARKLGLQALALVCSFDLLLGNVNHRLRQYRHLRHQGSVELRQALPLSDEIIGLDRVASESTGDTRLDAGG